LDEHDLLRKLLRRDAREMIPTTAGHQLARLAGRIKWRKFQLGFLRAEEQKGRAIVAVIGGRFLQGIGARKAAKKTVAEVEKMLPVTARPKVARISVEDG
jgi:hypothetical protein